MEKQFDTLKKVFGTHKAAAAAIGVSYTRYCEWRWRPDEMPAYSRELVKLAAEKYGAKEAA